MEKFVGKTVSSLVAEGYGYKERRCYMLVKDEQNEKRIHVLRVNGNEVEKYCGSAKSAEGLRKFFNRYSSHFDICRNVMTEDARAGLPVLGKKYNKDNDNWYIASLMTNGGVIVGVYWDEYEYNVRQKVFNTLKEAKEWISIQ